MRNDQQRVISYQERYSFAERRNHHAFFIEHLKRLKAEAAHEARRMANALKIARSGYRDEVKAGKHPGYLKNFRSVIRQLDYQTTVLTKAAIEAANEVEKHEQIYRKDFDVSKHQASDMEG